VCVYLCLGMSRYIYMLGVIAFCYVCVFVNLCVCFDVICVLVCMRACSCACVCVCVLA
jgi:hypothetical protein